METSHQVTFLKDEQAVLAMKESKNIRNISFLGHIDGGKTSIIDRIFTEESKQFNDVQRRPQNWKNLHFAIKYAQENYLINIANPGPFPDPSLIFHDTSADSTLIVVDCAEGFPVGTEDLLRRKIMPQKLKPILFLNKIDRLLDNGFDGEAIYQRLLEIIEAANQVISAIPQDGHEDWTFDPCKGNVLFGSAIHGWWFTLESYSRLLAQKFNLSHEKLQVKLWGDNYHNKETNKWTSEAGESGLERGFVRFLLNPIIKLTITLKEGDASKIENAIGKLGIQLSAEEMNLKGNYLLRAVFTKFLKPVDCLLKIFIEQLPSPQEAQKYRVSTLYERSEEDDVCFRGIQDCDPNGPLIIGIVRIAPITGETGFHALGRIFSGTVKPGQKVMIMDSYHQRGKKDYFVEKVKKVRLGSLEAKEGACAGNLVWLEGLEKYVMQNGTITDYEDASTIRIEGQKMPPIVQVEVKSKKPSDLPKLFEALRELARTFFYARITKEETGKLKVMSSSTDFLKIILGELRSRTSLVNLEIEISEVMPCYQEIVTQKSNQDCTISDNNTTNCFSAEACPLGEDLVSSIEKGLFNSKTKSQNRAQILVEEFKWNAQAAENLWAFGPESIGVNVLVNLAKDTETLSQIQESVVAGFQWATSEGVLIGERMNGVRINILDATISTTASHRESAKIIPLVRRVCLASELTAQPRLREPILVAEIWAPQEKLFQVCKALEPRGEIFEQISLPGGNQNTLFKAYLPVQESFNLQDRLRYETEGKAFFASSKFDHWKVIEEDPLDKSTNAYKIVSNLRSQKGLKDDLNLQYFKLTPLAY